MGHGAASLADNFGTMVWHGMGGRRFPKSNQLVGLRVQGLLFLIFQEGAVGVQRGLEPFFDF